MDNKASPRQVRVAVFVALLAPMAGLPAYAARFGGRGGWLAGVLAIPLALLGFWLTRRLGPAGLREALTDRWGFLGRAVCALYYLWALLLAGLTMGSCVDRLGRTDYAELSPWLLSAALGAAVWYLTRRGRQAFLRAAEIFFLVFVAVLALLGALGLWTTHWDSLAPRSVEDLAGAARGLLPVAGTLAVGTLGAFFPRTEPAGRRGYWAPAAWCLVAAGLCALVTGALGAALTGELPLPFFVALQGIGLPGGFQRLEALGTAVWVLSDLTLFGMTVLVGRTLAGDRAWGGWPMLLAGVLGGTLLTPEVTAPLGVGLLWTAVAFGGGVPLLLNLIHPRGKKK